MEERWPVLLLGGLLVVLLSLGLVLNATSPQSTVRVADDPVLVEYHELGPTAQNVTDDAIEAGERTFSRSEYPTESMLPQPREAGGGLEIGELKEKLVVRNGSVYRFTVAVGDGFNITVSNYTEQVVVDEETLPESVRSDVSRARETGGNVTLSDDGPFATGGYVHGLFGDDAYYLLRTDDGYVPLYVDRPD